MRREEKPRGPRKFTRSRFVGNHDGDLFPQIAAREFHAGTEAGVSCAEFEKQGDGRSLKVHTNGGHCCSAFISQGHREKELHRGNRLWAHCWPQS